MSSGGHKTTFSTLLVDSLHFIMVMMREKCMKLVFSLDHFLSDFFFISLMRTIKVFFFLFLFAPAEPLSTGTDEESRPTRCDDFYGLFFPFFSRLTFLLTQICSPTASVGNMKSFRAFMQRGFFLHWCANLEYNWKPLWDCLHCFPSVGEKKTSKFRQGACDGVRSSQ